MPTVPERLATIETDVRWIRTTFEKADLINRVDTLEKGRAKDQGANDRTKSEIAIGISVLSILLALYKAFGGQL